MMKLLKSLLFTSEVGILPPNFTSIKKQDMKIYSSKTEGMSFTASVKF